MERKGDKDKAKQNKRNEDDDDEAYDDDSDGSVGDGKKQGTEGEQWDQLRPVHRSFCDAFLGSQISYCTDRNKRIEKETAPLWRARLGKDLRGTSNVVKTIDGVGTSDDADVHGNDDETFSPSSADVALNLLWDFLEYTATSNRSLRANDKKREKGGSVGEDIVTNAMLSFLNLLSLEGCRGARKRFMERCAASLNLKVLDDGDSEADSSVRGSSGAGGKRRRFKDKNNGGMPVSSLQSKSGETCMILSN